MFCGGLLPIKGPIEGYGVSLAHSLLFRTAYVHKPPILVTASFSVSAAAQQTSLVRNKRRKGGQ